MTPHLAVTVAKNIYLFVITTNILLGQNFDLCFFFICLTESNCVRRYLVGLIQFGQVPGIAGSLQKRSCGYSPGQGHHRVVNCTMIMVDFLPLPN